MTPRGGIAVSLEHSGPDSSDPSVPAEAEDGPTDRLAPPPSEPAELEGDDPTDRLTPAPTEPGDRSDPSAAIPLERRADEEPALDETDELPPVSASQPPAAPPVVEAKRCPRCGTLFTRHVAFCPFDGEPVELAPDYDPAQNPLVGKVIADRYLVEGVLAEGSMGMVYRVRHLALGNAFAMKVLQRELAREEHLAERLVGEARATAAVGHPSIVAVTDFGEIGAETMPDLGELSLPYFVMELVTGHSLAELVRKEGSLAAERIARIMMQCANALAAAHEVGIIHRDLRPDNIRLTCDKGGEEVAKIVDFGVAKVIGSSRRTLAGVVFGTPHYMSPEQGQGHSVDHRTDVYALGVIMYEAATGSVPFDAETYMGVVTKHLFTRPEPVGHSGALHDVLLEPVIMRCLEKKPNDRYQSMRELVADLERVVRGEPMAGLETTEEVRAMPSERPSLPIPTVAPQAPAATSGSFKGRALPAAILAMALVVLVVSLVYLFGPFGAPESAPEREDAQSSAADPAAMPSEEPPSATTAPSATSAEPDTAAASSSTTATAEPTSVPAAEPTPPPTQPAPSPSPWPPPPSTKPSATESRTTTSPAPPNGVVDPWAER